MKALARVVSLALLVLVVAPTVAGAQDRSVLFVHGIWSDRYAWEGAAIRLQNELALSAQGHNTTDTAPYWNQADQLQSLTWNLPANTIAVGHSNGGIISRQLGRQRPLGGVITVGTPHRGTHLPANGARLAQYHGYLMARAGGLGYWLANQFGWTTQIEEVAYFIDNFLSGAVGALASRLSTVHSPVLANMGPSSSYRDNLNATVAQETFPKASISVVAADHGVFGLAAALRPNQRSSLIAVRASVAATMYVAAAWLDANYPPYSVQGMMADRFREVLSLGATMDNEWCLGVTNDFSCSAWSDGVVPTSSMEYPSPSAVKKGVWGPAHTQQTGHPSTQGVLYELLTEVMGIARRGSGGSGSGAGSGPPSYCTYVGRLVPGQSLSPNQSVCSPNGAIRLLYQQDGNLVLYGPGGAGWATNTVGSSLGSLEMQGDGNLVLYNGAGLSVWDTETWWASGAELELRDSGHMLIIVPGEAASWEIDYYNPVP
jgi:pimeloyl-ACP methyl ester carboxylesterase